MRRLAPIALGAFVASCAAAALPPAKPPCSSNADCSSSEVCFPEGCGDLGAGLVVEVHGDTRTGQLAQDFAIAQADFKPTIDIPLKPPTTLLGEFQRNFSPYTDSVTVKVRGESTLIPGVVRSYQATFASPERGTYSLPIGAGSFTVTAQADDPSIPPGLKDVTAEPGTINTVTFAFPSTDGTLTMTGRLIKRIQPGIPAIQIPVTEAPMQLQAFDPQTQKPLSQPVQSSATYGDFVIFIAPEAQKLDAIVLVASPRDPGSLVPSKTFTITRPFPVVIDPPLQLGDFGDSLPNMKGVVTTTTGVPVASASIYLSGGVNGGGIFTSQVVVTNAMGEFNVNLLPSATDGSYTLTALPAPGSTAGVLQTQVRAVAQLGQIATLKSVVTGTSTVVCPDKITVIGSVVTPKGTVGRGVSVVARAVQQLKELGNQPLPMGETTGFTDESGRFSLELDPGVYQIDFIPNSDLPRTSRIVTVKLESSPDGGAPTNTVDLQQFPLSKPRSVTGTITLPPNTNTGVAPVAVNAIVRYFHVTTIEGRPSSLLLGEAVTDEHGTYAVILPAH